MTKSAAPFNIDTWFDADDHVLLQHMIAAERHPRRLMPGYTESVTGAMQDIGPITGVPDYPQNLPVDVFGSDAGSNQFVRFLSGFHSECEQLSGLAGRVR
jgi:hypothetical protein